MPWEGDPPEDAYSRVTNPERFAPVLEAARELIADLVARYDAVAEPGEPGDFALGARVDFDRVVRVVPAGAASAPIVFGFTPFPGVHARFGHRTEQLYPVCGCDACDEQAPELIEELREDVGRVVAGDFTEALGRRSLEDTLGRTRHWSRLSRHDPRASGPRGTTVWQSWPER